MTDEDGETARGKLTAEVHDGVPGLKASDVTGSNFDIEELVKNGHLGNEHSGGTVTPDWGLDDPGKEGKVEFDLEAMAPDDTITVVVDGEEQEAHLQVTEDGTLKATTADGKPLFEASIDENNNWSMKQYDSFQVKDSEEHLSDSFSLKFKTEDSDGDIAHAESEVPLNPSVITPDKDNGNDNWTLQDDTPVTDPSGTPGGDPAGDESGGDPDSVSKAGNIVAGDFGGVTAGQTENIDDRICFLLDRSYSMHFNMVKDDASTLVRWEALVKSVQTFMESLETKEFTGDLTIGFIPFGTNVEEELCFDVEVSKTDDNTTYIIAGYECTDFNDFKKTLEDFLKKLYKDDDGNDTYQGQATNYDAAFKAAQDWFSAHGTGDQNSTYFLTDGSPTVHLNEDGSENKGDQGGLCLDKENIEEALKSYQSFLESFEEQGKTVDVHAVGFSSGVGQKGLNDLALFDNTPDTGTYENDGFIYYQTKNGDDVVWGDNKYSTDYSSGGRSAFADDADSLAGALDFTLPTLLASGNDTIDSSATSASSIIFGDILNTDTLLHELHNAGLAEDLIDGSGYEVFTWLENPENADHLVGTKFAGWNEDKTNDYIIHHIGELARETYVGRDGTFYTVDAEGTIYGEDGNAVTDGSITLDQLRGRSGGNDDITGSNQNDLIFGQEGNDTIHGGDGNDYLYGGTGNDTLSGGEGKDTLHGGTGDDLIVYDADDYAVFGGSGIDILLSNGTEDTLDGLLHNTAGDGKPKVDGVELFLKGDGVEDLTSMKELQEKYGITVDDKNGTVTLGEGWEKSNDGTYTYTGDDGQPSLTLETTLQPQSTDDAATQAANEIVLTTQG